MDGGPHTPVVIEIIDGEHQIDQFLPVLHKMVESGLVTLEKVRANRYRRRDSLEPQPLATPPDAA
jgi:hypothetical protein